MSLLISVNIWMMRLMTPKNCISEEYKLSVSTKLDLDDLIDIPL